MPVKLRFYIGVVITTGLLVCLLAAIQWGHPDYWKFGAYMFLTMLASGMKVSLPGITGTMSVSYVFILASIVSFDISQVICIAVTGSVVQSVYQAKTNLKIVQITFNAAAIAVVAWLSATRLVFTIPTPAAPFSFQGGVYFARL